MVFEIGEAINKFTVKEILALYLSIFVTSRQRHWNTFYSLLLRKNLLLFWRWMIQSPCQTWSFKSELNQFNLQSAINDWYIVDVWYILLLNIDLPCQLAKIQDDFIVLYLPAYILTDLFSISVSTAWRCFIGIGGCSTLLLEKVKINSFQLQGGG